MSDAITINVNITIDDGSKKEALEMLRLAKICTETDGIEKCVDKAIAMLRKEG